jgi:hypothetical protein
LAIVDCDWRLPIVIGGCRLDARQSPVDSPNRQFPDLNRQSTL